MINTPSIKQPDAWIPIVLTIAVLVVMAANFATVGVVRETDEGAVARLFQIWIALEALTIAFFAVKWLPRAAKKTLQILALQIIIALVPLAVVFFLHL